jgi:hypothetical protein
MANKKASPSGMDATLFRKRLGEPLFLVFALGNERKILRAASDGRIRRTTARHRSSSAAVDTSGRQAFAVDRLDKYARYLLRESSMLGCGTTSQRFF